MSLGALLVDRAASIPDYEFPVARTDAFERAAANFEANRIALERSWPASALALPDAMPELEWLYARDGSLSARHIDGRWVADVSVPRRAAERLLAALEAAGSAAVMLAPTHAQQVRVTLSRLSDRQALIVVQPGEYAAGILLACEDFSAEIRDRRLFLIAGPDWRRELDALLEQNIGLAPAATMIRVPGLNDAVVDRIVKPCEQLLARHGKSHRERLALLHARPRTPAKPARRACVVTGRFKLWAAEGTMLAEAAARSSIDCVTFDASRPDCASALALARRAEDADALVTANLSRADLPMVVPTSIPWLTFCTSGRLPAFASAGPRDRLILIDAAQRPLASAAGWPGDRVDAVASRPAARPSTGRLALIADFRPPTKPAALAEMSSRGLVWDRVVAAIEHGAIRQAESPAALVRRVADAAGVATADLPLDTLYDTAVLPAFARATALRLAGAGIAFDLYGKGWESVEDLRGHWRGPIADRATFDAALAGASAVVDVWPFVTVHASRYAGRPLLTTWGRSDAQVASDLQRVGRHEACLLEFDLDAAIGRA